jgi:hypothetical protein
MGRSVRRVPKDWEHPKKEDGSGQYQPMHDEPFKRAAQDWLDACLLWAKGEHPDQNDEWAKEHNVKERYPFYWQYCGEPPDDQYYRPDWPEESRTHLQMYENTSEGTPISPVMETPEELAHWLADNNASAFAGQTATYEQWLATIKRGWAPSMIIPQHADGTGTMESGVSFMAQP